MLTMCLVGCASCQELRLRWCREFNGARKQGTNKGVSRLTLEKDFVLVVETMEVTTKVKRKPKPQKV
jgi:hypothetical protein